MSTVMKFGMSVPERKKMEEGATSLFTAHQWGYIEATEALDALISWLDIRGINEVKLHKELKLYRDRIARNMEKRKEYLNPAEDKSVDSGPKRLSWHNSTALEELGHLHSDQPRARKPAKKAAAAPPPVVEEERQTRSEGKGKRQKSLGQQGTRYEFS